MVCVAAAPAGAGANAKTKATMQQNASGRDTRRRYPGKAVSNPGSGGLGLEDELGVGGDEFAEQVAQLTLLDRTERRESRRRL